MFFFLSLSCFFFYFSFKSKMATNSCEKVWMDKSSYDKAECLYQERLGKVKFFIKLNHSKIKNLIINHHFDSLIQSKLHSFFFNYYLIFFYLLHFILCNILTNVFFFFNINYCFWGISGDVYV